MKPQPIVLGVLLLSSFSVILAGGAERGGNKRKARLRRKSSENKADSTKEVDIPMFLKAVSSSCYEKESIILNQKLSRKDTLLSNQLKKSVLGAVQKVNPSKRKHGRDSHTDFIVEKIMALAAQ